MSCNVHPIEEQNESSNTAASEQSPLPCDVYALVFFALSE